MSFEFEIALEYVKMIKEIITLKNFRKVQKFTLKWYFELKVNISNLFHHVEYFIVTNKENVLLKEINSWNKLSNIILRLFICIHELKKLFLSFLIFVYRCRLGNNSTRHDRKFVLSFKLLFLYHDICITSRIIWENFNHKISNFKTVFCWLPKKIYSRILSELPGDNKI